MAILLYLMACLMSPPPLIHLAESQNDQALGELEAPLWECSYNGT